MDDIIRSLMINDESGRHDVINDNDCKNSENSNGNSNNLCNRDVHEISDWEDFNIDDNDITLDFIKNDDRINNSNIRRRESVLHDEFEDIDDNFELMVSEDEDPDTKKTKKSKSSDKERPFNIDCDKGNYRTNCCLYQLKDGVHNRCRQLWEMLTFINVIFVILPTYPVDFIGKLFTALKTYTNSTTILMVPFKILPCIIKSLLIKYLDTPRTILKEKGDFISKENQHLLTMNSNNNNSSETCEEQSSSLFCSLIFLTAILIGGLFTYCWFVPQSKACSVNMIFYTIKGKLWDIFNEIYILPGDDCMRAGRCCKGFLEATFRWTNCLLTLPIRSALTAWPRQVLEKEVLTESTDDIKNSVEKIIQELNEAKSRTNKQEELLLKLRKQFTALEKLIEEKSKDISKLEPMLKTLTQLVQQMNLNVTYGMNQMQNIISIRYDSEKIIETMKAIARDSSNALKSSISKVQTQIEAEQNRLVSRIESLESVLNDDESKVADSTILSIHRVKADFDLLKVKQDELRSKLNAFSDVPVKYRTFSEKLKADVKTKLAEEVKDHDSMSKKTECFCMTKINNFKEDLEKSKTQFSCYIESATKDHAAKVQENIKTNIATNFYDKTVEISKSVAEDVMDSFAKGHDSSRNTIKGSAFLTELTKIEPTPYICSLDNSEKMMNLSAFCLDNKSLNDSFNDDGECLSNNQINKMVKMAIAKYSADKIGLADFALESMGGSVIVSRSSSTYNGRKGLFSFFSMTQLKVSNSLRTIILPGNQPGDCWPFPGTTGHAVIQLAHTILVSAISLEHLAVSLHPDGKIRSAPKQFQIYSLYEKSYEKKDLIGTFEYQKDGPPIQTFLVEKPVIANLIQMDVLSNHGQQKYTCIYRLRVHGSLLNDTMKS